MGVKLLILQISGWCLLCIFTEVASKNTAKDSGKCHKILINNGRCNSFGTMWEKYECGKLVDKAQIPWTVGIYLEKEKDRLELVCLGTILKENYVITAAQCVCESLSNELRKERIFVSTEFQKQIREGSHAVTVKTKDVISRSDYQGFLINPKADLAILKLESPQELGSPVCIDWSDLNFLLEDGTSGIFPLWNNNLKTLDISFLDHDTCMLSTSKDFENILDHDKNCFTVSASDLVPESIGAGIYFKSPKDGKWYLEGIVSGKEVSSSEVFVAGTSIKQYLPWLSRVCT